MLSLIYSTSNSAPRKAAIGSIKSSALIFPLIELFGELMPNESIRPGNSSVTAATLENGCWQVTLKNYEAHLGSDATAPVAYV